MQTTADAHLARCPDCATLQRMPDERGRWNLLACATCAAPLVRRNGRDRRLALAFAAAGAVLLLPANLLPFLGTSIAGVSRDSVLADSATAMAGNGFPELALVIGLFAVVLPPLRLLLLSGVLSVLEFGRGARPAWLGPAFRVACGLADWAMADVFLLGFAVAAARLATSISRHVGIGAWCFVAAGILTLLTRATLDVPAVWRAIGDDTPALAVTATPTNACGACALLLPASADGTPCPRCREPRALLDASRRAPAAEPFVPRKAGR